MIADFADSYAAGETPVPCVRCNQTVKFNDLTALARGLGAERLATGHYVRRMDGPDGPELHRAADPARDQSWFLFATTRAQLDFALFPLGGMADKAAVRREAARLGLAGGGQAGQPGYLLRPGGQLRRCGGAAAAGCRGAGRHRRSDGRALGRHDGVARYTVGQARRLGAAAEVAGVPQVVVALDARHPPGGGRAAHRGHGQGAAARGQLADRRRRRRRCAAR